MTKKCNNSEYGDAPSQRSSHLHKNTISEGLEGVLTLRGPKTKSDRLLSKDKWIDVLEY